jgi:hypothetical protein
VTFFAWYLLGLGRPASEAVLGERRGRQHAWMVHEGLTVDLTADQFVDGQPPIVVAERCAWLDGWAVKDRWTIDARCGLDAAMFVEYANAYRSVLRRLPPRVYSAVE